MDKRIKSITLFICLIFPVINSQWVLQYHPAGFTAFYDIQFIDSLTGFVVGDNNTILKTTNGGVTWTPKPTNLSYIRSFYGISMLNAYIGYAVGSFETTVKTYNGGESWYAISESPEITGHSNFDVSFIDSETGWICSSGGRILITYNGGNVWDTISINSVNQLNVMQFMNPLTGWVAGEGGFCKKTTNGGLNWDSVFFGTNADFGYNSMHFVNDSVGWLAADRDMIFNSTDGGNSWNSMYSNSYCQSIRFYDQQTGWCGGSESFTNRAILYKSTDSGNNWVEQPLPFGSGYCSGISIYSDSIAWAVYGHRIIHTTNGGDPIGITSINEQVPDGFNLRQNYPNPFNSSTTIEYEVNVKGFYKLEVHDASGKLVEAIFNTEKEPGRYKLNYNPVNRSSGVYFYSLTGNYSRLAKKFILIK